MLMKENQTEELQPQEELVSLNDNLRSEYSVRELEQRLETDPLLLSGLLSDIMPLCDCKKGYICIHIEVCTCNTEVQKPCTCKADFDTEVDV